MQTFLPYPSFVDSARCLDRQRLGKQRVEAKQLLTALEGGSAWAQHPAAKMWRRYEVALSFYGFVCCSEWIARGYKDSLRPFFKERMTRLPAVCSRPPWLGDPAFHASHRSNLLRKDPAHYGQFGWSEPSDLPYVWP